MHSEELVREVIGDLIDVDEEGLGPDTRLADVDGWDSVNALRVLLYLERETGSRLDYDAFERAETIAELASVVEHADADGAAS